MRAVIQITDGDPSTLVIDEDTLPQMVHRGLLIRVQYAAINRMDLLQSKGNYPLPKGASKIIGVEVSGTIAAVGDGCELGFVYGEPVAALLLGGGYAEFCIADERHVIRLFPRLNMQTMAAVPEAFMTAYQLCFMVGNIKKGESVLVHAAASSVGQAAIQMLSRKGIKVFATVRSEAKLKTCLDLGATAAFVVDSRDVSFAEAVLQANDGNLIDVVLDPVCSAYMADNIKLLNIDGRWVLYGMMGGATITEPALLQKLMAKRISLLPTTLRSRSAEYKEEIIQKLSSDPDGFPAIASGEIKVIVDRTYPLEEVLSAHQYMEQNKNTGKIILAVTSTSTALEFFASELQCMEKRLFSKK